MMTKQAELKKQAYDSNLKSRALSILIYLIDRSNKDLTCFPAISTMAEQLHISVSTVKRALHELVEVGFIKKDARHRADNRGQTSNLYTLILKENAPAPKESKKPAEPANTVVVETTIAQTTEKQTTSVVMRIDFETLKAEQENRKEAPAADEPVPAPTEEIPVTIKETAAEDRPVEMHQLKRTEIRKLAHIIPLAAMIRVPVFTLHKNKGKACKPVQLLWQKALPFFSRWTGVGFNLRPP